MNNREHPEIAIFPWLPVNEPVTVCGVTWYPRASAIERAGNATPNVEAATSYFYDHFRYGDLALGDALELQRLQPSVIFLSDEIAHGRVELATHVYSFATIFANNSVSYANSTTFDHFYQRIGGNPEMNARRTRRMHGSQLSGSPIQNLLETRPAWCGAYHAPSGAMLRALEATIQREDAEPIREALEALMLATQDADVTPASAEHAFYARAFERLLHRPGQDRNKRKDAQVALCDGLLASLLPPKEDGDKSLYHIIEARHAASDKRNAFWHPEDARLAKYPFEKQLAVHPNLIAFRAAAAVIVASIHSLDASVLDEKLKTFVPAVETWIGSIQEEEERSPEDASNIDRCWSALYLRRRTVLAIAKAQESPELREALDVLRSSSAD